MFIGFLSFTNEAVITEVEEKDLSILDESVMHDLNFRNDYRQFIRWKNRTIIFGEIS